MGSGIHRDGSDNGVLLSSELDLRAGTLRGGFWRQGRWREGDIG